MPADNEPKTMVEMIREQTREMLAAYLIAKFGIQVPMFGRIHATMTRDGTMVVIAYGAHTLKAAK